MRPLVTLLLRHGLTYPAFAAALKRVFLQVAHDELARQNMPRSDSALTLISGVHRRDVRALTRPSEDAGAAGDAADASLADATAAGHPAPLSVAGEVIARWLVDPDLQGADGQPRRLPKAGERGSFDALVASVSSDVRPRAMLDELLRLGVVNEDAEGIAMVADGFAPRQGFEAMSALFTDNLHDHISAASANLQGKHNFLEQAVYVDQISAESAAKLQAVARLAWRQALKTVMSEAQARFDADAKNLPEEERVQRARFGVYFFHDSDGS